MDERVDSSGRGEAGAEQHQQEVARRPGDDAGDHGRGPDALAGSAGCAPASANPFSAALRLLSASIRKLAEVTTASPSDTPWVTSTKPPPRRPSFTSRGSKRPSPLSTRTAWRVPLSRTALSGTASTGPGVLASISASTYISGCRSSSG